MPPNPAQPLRVRAEIFEHAGRLFRLRGYAGTNIDDIMLAAGLTRGAFYAHFESKDDLFAEVIRAGEGLLVEAARPRRRRCWRCSTPISPRTISRPMRWAAPWRRCRATSRAAPCPPSSPMPTSCTAVIGEMARGRRRKLDPDATAAAILAVGAISLARASGDRRLSDWLLRCARRAARALLAPKPPRRASPKPATIPLTPESRWRSSAQTRCTITRWSGLSFTSGAFFWIQPISRSGPGELVVVEATARRPSRRRRSSRRRPRGTAA